MVQQRSDRRDDLRLSRGDADDHLLRAVEVRINRLFPLSTSFILHAIPRLLLLSSSFFFFFLFLSFFFSFFFGSLDSFEFFAIRRKDEKWDGERICKISRYSVFLPRRKHATQAGHRLVFTHSTLANAISVPPSHDNRHSFVIVQLQTIHDAVTQY